ncbi:MAG: elongation factor G [Candidatus Dormibacteraeota bacterium]|uniref:Elongation factor G n=1 Tax=Candidatus Amunia macphersoniae TaxID=3127014 RepID=A0A934KMD6_9BACT|nr:elongation factor G [Candidatus Dormibacteraeota bacterium]
MPLPSPERIRTVAVVGHSHDGKTTLCEALLHTAGATPRMGSTDHGTSILDHEPEEQRRSMSIAAAVAHLDWEGHRVNLIDVPGFQDFAGELAAALTAADAVVLVVGAGGSVPVGAELAWDMVAARHLPTLVVVNKMDKENAAYEATVDALREAFGRKPIAVAVPIGSSAMFTGYVDLVNDSAHAFGSGGTARDADLPEAMSQEVERAHAALVDAAAETDDALIEKYLGGGELTDDEVRGALHTAALRGTLVPIVCAAAADERGAGLVLDSIVRYLPGPSEQVHHGHSPDGEQVEIACDPGGPLVAHVFKTTVDSFGKVSYFKVLRGTMRADTHPYDVQQGLEERFAQLARPMGKALVNATEVGAGDIGAVTKLAHARTGDALGVRGEVLTLPAMDIPVPSYSAAITARTKGDEDKIMSSLARLAEEDPAFSIDRDPVTGEVMVHGLGDVHLDVSLERIKRKYGVDALLAAPRIAYRETISGTARVAHKHKKQSGGAGLYGDCTIEVEPLPRGGGFVWEDKIFGGAIPHQFRPSVEKGVRQTMEQGAVSGNLIVDVKVRLVDGSTHAVDGKDIAFQIAGAMAMREAVQKANPVLLEPIMHVHAVVPERFMGDVMGLFNGKRGRVAGMNPLGDGRAEVSAQVPQAEMHSFPSELRALTQGRGRYTMTPARYEEVPAHVAQAIIAAHSKEHATASA